MFSQTMEYALRVMVHLASLPRDAGAPTIAQIAVATQTPKGYLAKVLRNLGRAKLVISQRGVYGGTTLARPADQISVYDVAEAVDPIERILTCPLGFKSHGTNLCPMHRRLDDAIATVEKALRDSTLAELLADRTGSTPMRE